MPQNKTVYPTDIFDKTGTFMKGPIRERGNRCHLRLNGTPTGR